MASPARNIQAALSNVLDFLCEKILFKTTVARDLTQGESAKLHRLLCAYAVRYIDQSTELPGDVVDASRNLTDEEKADLEVLGRLGEECRQIERAICEEWAGLSDDAKRILKTNAQRGDHRIKAFSRGMPLWQSLMLGAITSANITWDVWAGIAGPDSSLFPRVVSLSASTASAVVGFLIAPGANLPQIFEAIFQDRVVLGTPQRIVYTAGTDDHQFYDDKANYISAVAVSAITLFGLLTLPRPIKDKIDDHTAAKAGKKPVSEEDQAEHSAMADNIVVRADVLKELQEKLREVAERHLLGEGTSGQITRIRGQAHRLSNLLLRVVDRYVVEKHAEHEKKAAVIILWNAVIASMLGAARNNAGQIGVLVSYIAHSERRMIETLVDASKGSKDMIDLFTRAGAPILYHFFFIAVPLLSRGPKAFDRPAFKGWMTGMLTVINLTVIHYTPSLIFMIGDKSQALAGGVMGVLRRLKQQTKRVEGPPAEPEDDDAFFDALEEMDDEEFFDASASLLLPGSQEDDDDNEQFYDAQYDPLMVQGGDDSSRSEQFFDAPGNPAETELWAAVTELVRDVIRRGGSLV